VSEFSIIDGPAEMSVRESLLELMINMYKFRWDVSTGYPYLHQRPIVYLDLEEVSAASFHGLYHKSEHVH
jgi:hypothetical protein